MKAQARRARPAGSPLEVLLAFTRLGVSSFGGPIAHLGYFRREFVERRTWVSESTYASLVALCQFLPGPASSQVGFSIGLARAGYAGALAAWAGFTLPSAAALVALHTAPGRSRACSAARCCTACDWSRWRWLPRPCARWRARCARTVSAPRSRCSPC